jgi:four helix bundle protein
MAADITEGQGRRSSKEFSCFLANAKGSLLELDTHLELLFRVSYLNEKQHLELRNKMNEVCKIINGLLRSLTKTDI